MRLTQTDASFLYTESANGPMHISSVYVLEGELPFEGVFEHFQGRLHLMPALRRKIAFVPFNIGHPKWIDDSSFELANHLEHIELAANTDFETAFDIAVTLNEPMLDRTKPLWKCFVISGVENRTLILTMVHHALIDGASGVDLTTIIYDIDPDTPLATSPAEPWVPNSEQTHFERLAEAFAENLGKLESKNAFDWLPNSRKQRALLLRAAKVITNFVSKPVLTAPFNAGLVGPKRHARYIKKSFGEIREIRRALGGTINDVVLAVVSEAVARYLNDHGENLDDQHLRIMCPVNVRTQDKVGALGNQVSAIFPTLPAWPMPMENRLGSVCAEMQRIKVAEEAQALSLLNDSSADIWPVALMPAQLIGTAFDPTRLTAKFPPPVMPNIGWRPPNLGINFVCTNVPGVQVPQYLGGHQVLDTAGLLVLTGNIGFSITILSYNKQLFFSFICEPRLLPDLERIVTNTNDSFTELLDLARQRTNQLSSSA